MVSDVLLVPDLPHIPCYIPLHAMPYTMLYTIPYTALPAQTSFLFFLVCPLNGSGACTRGHGMWHGIWHAAEYSMVYGMVEGMVYGMVYRVERWAHAHAGVTTRHTVSKKKACYMAWHGIWHGIWHAIWQALRRGPSAGRCAGPFFWGSGTAPWTAPAPFLSLGGCTGGVRDAMDLRQRHHRRRRRRR